ncbi:5-demethoxyubiquinone hydroxylase, mitochondrial [Cimex lectularius]|uniref:5-demethoxyubiquinone hydroxylase, mitochondrial n=1 Tax=Cimex lectularius TaxID=79782 RepID=A0A8I6SA31_CIMLE|nr:5-demethoxyubiquinone hydroxylase, mitochondrial [Cimex lectularius]
MFVSRTIRPLTIIGQRGMQSASADVKPKPTFQKRVEEDVDSIIRVDHAGEFGADRIYAGQMAVLGNTTAGPMIKKMWEQEIVHKKTFEELIVKHRVRPTALLPLWDAMGFMLGAGSALLGKKGAMACTVAVESVIVDHYNEQLRYLLEKNSSSDSKEELLKVITKFRDEEQEHHNIGIKYGALEAPFYEVLTAVIKFGCKTAIEISKKI